MSVLVLAWNHINSKHWKVVHFLMECVQQWTSNWQTFSQRFQVVHTWLLSIFVDEVVVSLRIVCAQKFVQTDIGHVLVGFKNGKVWTWAENAVDFHKTLHKLTYSSAPSLPAIWSWLMQRRLFGWLTYTKVGEKRERQWVKLLRHCYDLVASERKKKASHLQRRPMVAVERIWAPLLQEQKCPLSTAAASLCYAIHSTNAMQGHVWTAKEH